MESRADALHVVYVYVYIRNNCLHISDAFGKDNFPILLWSDLHQSVKILTASDTDLTWTPVDRENCSVLNSSQTIFFDCTGSLH